METTPFPTHKPCSLEPAPPSIIRELCFIDQAPKEALVFPPLLKDLWERGREGLRGRGERKGEHEVSEKRACVCVRTSVRDAQGDLEPILSLAH